MEYDVKKDCNGANVYDLKINPEKLDNYSYTLVVEKVEGTNPTGTISIARSLYKCDNFVTVVGDDGSTPLVVTVGASAYYEVDIDPVVAAGVIERVRCTTNLAGGMVNIRLLAN